MGEVKAYRKKHWTGLDADLASIPSPQEGDSYLATDKNKLYYWEGGAWKTGLGYEWVPRAVSAWDKGIGDFTVDGAVHVDGLNLSAIIPAGAVSAQIEAVGSASAANKLALLRKNAVDTQNTLAVQSQVAGVITPYADSPLMIDSDRLLDYQIDVTFTILNVKVLGWFI